MLLFAALLFVWRNSVSLLPEREPVTAAMTPQPAASLRTLLAAACAEKETVGHVGGRMEARIAAVTIVAASGRAKATWTPRWKTLTH
jgi:hypothetical protein